MKSKVLDRPMFRGASRPDIDNIGIMQGFMDQGSSGDMEETPDDLQPSQNDEDMEASHMADRRPGSPEILMNNLRGDMRSVDARYKELADLFGPAVARDTPEEVLALLQPVLAGAKGGIGALPEAQALPGMTPVPAPAPFPGGMPLPPGSAPPGGMPPPPSLRAAAQGPQGAPGPFPSAPNAGETPGQGPAPVNMAGGGDVGMVANAGRFGDSQLAYLSPSARQMLVDQGGSGTINPNTGLPEYAWWDTLGRLGAGGIRDAAGNLFRKPEVFNGATATAGEVARAGQRITSGLSPNIPGGALYPLRQGAEAVGTAVAGAGRLAAQYPRTAVGLAGTGAVGTAALMGYGRPRQGVDAASAPPGPPGGPGSSTSVVPVVPDNNAGALVGTEVQAPVVPDAVPGAVPDVVPPTKAGDGTNDFLSRTNKRFGELKQALSSPEDKDWMQAQALFLLADAALKIPSAGGRTPLETVSRAGAGIPAGFAALGAQQAGKETKIRAAAAEQVLGEQSDERKFQQQERIAQIRALATAAERNRSIQELLASVKASHPDLNPQQQMTLALGLNNKTIIQGTDLDGEPALVNILRPEQVFSSGVNAPKRGMVGFVGEDNPLAKLVPPLNRAPKAERSKIQGEIRASQDVVREIDDVLGGDFAKAFGPGEYFRAIVGGITLPLFGTNAPFANVMTDDKASAIKQLSKALQRSVAAGGSRVSVQEQDEIKAWLEKPGNFFTDPMRAFAIINRIKTGEINSISDGFNRLYPDQYSARRIDPNAPIGMTEGTALNVMDTNTLRILGDLAKSVPGYQPYVTSGPGKKAERIKDLPAFMAQEEIQKRLNPKQGAQ